MYSPMLCIHVFAFQSLGMIQESESRFVDGGGDLKKLQATMAAKSKAVQKKK